MQLLLLSCVSARPPAEDTDVTTQPDTDSGLIDTSRTDTADDTANDTSQDTAVAPGACGMEASERRWCASCAQILEEYPETLDGPVVIQTLGSSITFHTWCEMDLAGGGWTLVATNGWGGEWDERNILTDSTFGEPSLSEDYKGRGFIAVPFRDLLFENDVEYAVYSDVGDATAAYQDFQEGVPVDNCGIDTDYVWPMTEGTFEDPDLCEPGLYINVRDWEGGLIPCGDNESARGPAWSTQNKDLGCPLNDPRSSSFILDEWDYNPWGDHDPATTNLPLRMWVR